MLYNIYVYTHIVTIIYYNMLYKYLFFLSQNILYKCNVFSILNKHFLYIMVITFAVWGTKAKAAWISSSFFTISWIKRFVLTINLSILSIWLFSFIIKSRSFTFSLKGRHLQLLFIICMKLFSLTPLVVGGVIK